MSFADKWAAAADNSEFRPPKGTYHVEIVPATQNSAWETNDGREFAKILLKITKGEHEGKIFEHFLAFQPDGPAKRSREALLAYGLQDPAGIRDISDIASRIDDLVGTTSEVGVSYGGDEGQYLNVSVTGSRPPVAQRESDIPANGTYTDGMERAREQQADFASAMAKADDDTPPF